MPLEPVPGVARVTVNGTLAGVAWANVYHVLRTPGVAWPQADISALVTGFRALIVSRFVPLQAAACVTTTVEAIDLTNDLGVTAEATGSTAGTQGTGENAANVALVVSWKIARHYRGGHPRTYYAGTRTANMSTGNTWLGSVVNAWAAAAEGLRTDVINMLPNGSEVQLVCVHRHRNKVKLVPPVWDLLTGAAVDSRIDSQRRRLGPDR